MILLRRWRIRRLEKKLREYDVLFSSPLFFGSWGEEYDKKYRDPWLRDRDETIRKLEKLR